jgi:hypothetical protein
MLVQPEVFERWSCALLLLDLLVLFICSDQVLLLLFKNNQIDFELSFMVGHVSNWFKPVLVTFVRRISLPEPCVRNHFIGNFQKRCHCYSKFQHAHGSLIHMVEISDVSGYVDSTQPFIDAVTSALLHGVRAWINQWIPPS